MSLEDRLEFLQIIPEVIHVCLESPDLSRYPEGSSTHWTCFVTERETDGTIFTYYYHGDTALEAVIKAYDETEG